MDGQGVRLASGLICFWFTLYCISIDIDSASGQP